MDKTMQNRGILLFSNVTVNAIYTALNLSLSICPLTKKKAQDILNVPKVLLSPNQLTNQSINQPTNEKTNQPTNQSVSQSITNKVCPGQNYHYNISLD